MAGQGLTGLMGAAGAAEGFETLMTRRLLEQRQAEQERATRAQEMQAQAQLDEQKHYREMQAGELERSHTENEKARRVSMALMQPIGSFNPSSAVDPLLKDYPELTGFFDPVNAESKVTMGPNGEKRTSTSNGGYRFRGKEADITDREKARGVSEDRDLDRQTRVTLAQLAASNSSNRVARIAQIKTPDGQYVTVAVNNDGSITQLGDTPEPGGIRTQKTNLNSVVDQLQHISDLGEQTQWSGTGFLQAPMAGLLKRVTGFGSDEADTLRTMVDSLKADIAHEKYGSAFTNSERQALQTFAPGSSMAPAAIRNRIKVMQAVMSRKAQALSTGQALPPININDLMQMEKSQAPGGSQGQPGAVRVVSVSKVPVKR